MRKIYTHISDAYFIECMKKMGRPEHATNDMNKMPADELLKMVQTMQEELERRKVVNG